MASQAPGRLSSMTAPLPLASLPPALIGLLYLTGYAALDWASFIYPFGSLGITPWDPATGLSFTLILVFGPRYLPLLIVAELLADTVVRRLSVPFHIEALSCLIIGGGYGLAARLLLHPKLAFDVSLPTMRDVLLLMGMAVSSTAIVSGLDVLLLVFFEQLSWKEFVEAIIRYWVGDVIGIAVITPFLLILLAPGGRMRFTWELVAQIGVVAMALWLVFLFGLPFFYILFLPIVGVAVRGGLEGVSAALVVTQLALVASLEVFAPEDVDVTAFQARMLVLTLTGLVAGVLVSERRRAELQLRLQQTGQARLAQQNTMSELAAALAHEINQPLMAAGTYTRLAAEAMASNPAPAGAAREAMQKAAAQVERAAAVVRRLRELIRFGRIATEPTVLASIVRRSIELLQPEVGRGKVTVRAEIDGGLPLVATDRLQIEQVLINLVRNALEAMREAGMQWGSVVIEAQYGPPGFAEIRVRDSGPGFPPQMLTDLPQAFTSTKADGLGLGLSLCRTIAEAHGGRLWIGESGSGAVIHFTLPFVEQDQP